MLRRRFIRDRITLRFFKLLSIEETQQVELQAAGPEADVKVKKVTMLKGVRPKVRDQKRYGR
jgi:hypothetical protein